MESVVLLVHPLDLSLSPVPPFHCGRLVAPDDDVVYVRAGIPWRKHCSRISHFVAQRHGGDLVVCLHEVCPQEKLRYMGLKLNYRRPKLRLRGCRSDFRKGPMSSTDGFSLGTWAPGRATEAAHGPSTAGPALHGPWGSMYLRIHRSYDLLSVAVLIHMQKQAQSLRGRRFAQALPTGWSGAPAVGASWRILGAVFGPSTAGSALQGPCGSMHL